MKYAKQRELIVESGRRLYQNGFVPGTDGNLSCRTDDRQVLITPSGAAKGHLRPEDIILVDFDGKPISDDGKPSSEIMMHIFVYKNRPDIAACCHAHPPYSTAFSVLGRNLPADVLPEVLLSLGDIPLTDYAPPGTEAVPDSLKPYIHNHQAFILRNHGVLTIGRDMEEAFNRMEMVEHFAKILYIAEGVGEINHLDKAEVERLKNIGYDLKRGRKL